MAGFFGLFDYSKPGKGVDKNGPQKKRFFYFFELYFRKFWKLITLNLLFVLFCLPIVTIGPAVAAMSKVLKDFAMERAVFLWSDFFEAFKKNFKQGFIMGLIDIVAYFLIITAVLFYSQQVAENPMLYVPLILVMAVGLILTMMNYYIFIMIPVLDMKLREMIKNAFFLSILGIKTNLCTLIFTTALLVAAFYYILIGILLAVVILISTVGFIIVFNSYQYIEKYIIEPYYEKTGEKRPDVFYFDEDEFEEFIFEDIGTLEKPVETKTMKKGKTIK